LFFFTLLDVKILDLEASVKAATICLLHSVFGARVRIPPSAPMIFNSLEAVLTEFTLWSFICCAACLLRNLDKSNAGAISKSFLIISGFESLPRHHLFK